MARINLSTIEQRLEQMKRADNSWAEVYVRDVSHLLKLLKAATEPANSVPATPAEIPTNSCNFCGNSGELIPAARGFICKECLAICREMVVPAEVSTGEAREFDHFSIVPFKAICGADVANQSTTQTPERAKCSVCWFYWKEFESSRAAVPAVASTPADKCVKCGHDVLTFRNGVCHYGRSGNGSYAGCGCKCEFSVPP